MVSTTTSLDVIQLLDFGPEDQGRLEEMRLRRRLLSGQHEGDVRRANVAAFGLERASAMTWVDTAANCYVQLWTTLAALYTYTPRVRGASPAQRAVVVAMQECGHWARMVRTQRDILALREVFILLSWDKATQTLQERVVEPDYFEAPRSLRRDPTRVAQIAVHFRSGRRFERHSYQIEAEDGSARAEYRISRHGESDEVWSGDAYPYRDGAGQPIIPGVLYHAAETGTLLDWQTGGDIVRGALRLMVFYTGAGHVIIDASWAQRVIIDGVVGGETFDMSDPGQRRVVVADPATVLEVTTAPGSTQQAQVTNFVQPQDPEGIMRTIAMYAQMFSRSAGVRTPDATRGESDIRSGYSLAVSREAIMEMQAGYAPTFRRADQQLLYVAACLMGVPSAGPGDYTIQYQSLSMSPAELTSRLAAIKSAREQGLMSQLDAMLFLYPWMTVEEAQEKIDGDEIANETNPSADTEPEDDDIPA